MKQHKSPIKQKSWRPYEAFVFARLKRRGKRQVRVGGWVRSTLSLRYLTVGGEGPFPVLGKGRMWGGKGSYMMLVRGSTVIAKIFICVKILHSSVRELSYAINFRTSRAVSHTGIRTWLSYATNFRTFSQKYEIYEINSHTKISAITVFTQVRGRGTAKKKQNNQRQNWTRRLKVLPSCQVGIPLRRNKMYEQWRAVRDASDLICLAVDFGRPRASKQWSSEWGQNPKHLTSKAKKCVL